MKKRFARVLAGLGAMALAGGCHLALSSFAKRTGASGETTAPVVAESTPAPAPEPAGAPAPAPTPAPEPAPEPTTSRSRPESEVPRTQPPATTQPPREFVTYAANERVRPGTYATCRVSGRGEICDGVCTDVQVSNDNCGACGIRCHPGNHCDFSTCRDAEGKPQ